MTAATLPALRNDTVIARLEAARTALSEAKTIQQSKAIADVAAAAEIYARRQKLGEEAIDFAHAVKIEALRKLGELLKETPKNAGANGVLPITGSKRVPVMDDTPTLADLGIDKKTSAMAQKLADLPDKDFQAVRDGHEAVGAAIAKASSSRGSSTKAKPKKAEVSDAELAKLRKAVEELTEQNGDLADTARELEDKLTAFEKTEPDDQQKEIMKLQKRIVALEGEVDRITKDRDHYKTKCNELIRQVKLERKKNGG